MTAKQIVARLASMHPTEAGWLFVPELRIGTGFSCCQSLDAFAMHSWPSKNLLRRAFEVKISASDVLKELRDPDKRWRAYAVSHEFYFVSPPGLINPKLLTKDDGLIECDETTIKVVKSPRVREAMPPRWDFVAALLRRYLP